MVTLEVRDPDAEVFAFDQCAPNTVRFGDEEVVCESTPGCAPFDVQSAPTPGELVEEFVHVYAEPGVYTVQAIVQTGSLCPHPFASAVTVELDVHVE